MGAAVLGRDTDMSPLATFSSSAIKREHTGNNGHNGTNLDKFDERKQTSNPDTNPNVPRMRCVLVAHVVLGLNGQIGRREGWRGGGRLGLCLRELRAARARGLGAEVRLGRRRRRLLVSRRHRARSQRSRTDENYGTDKPIGKEIYTQSIGLTCVVIVRLHASCLSIAPSSKAH